MNSPARPLVGQTIVVTRPARQAAALSTMIEDAGGVALRFPAIEIEPVSSPELEVVVDELGTADLAIFISRNAVEQGLSRALASRAWPAGLASAAVGSGTRQALEAQGILDAFSPEGPADSEALLAHHRLQAVAGKRIVIFRGEGGRELLAATLRARGANVTYAECYRRVMPAGDPARLIDGLSSGKAQAVVVSSGAGLANLVAVLGSAARELLGRSRLFVPHPRVATQAKGYGFEGAVVGGPADHEMLMALVAYFSRKG